MVSMGGLKALTNGNMKIHKVLALPASLEEDAIYFVKNGIGADLYIVSNEGTATKVSSGVDYGLTLGEDSDTAYRGDRGKFAYDHAQSPHVETKTDIGLGHVNNTSDLDKPISDDTQAALDTKAEPITVAEVAPGSPDEGDMWFDTVIGQLYAYYTDGDSGQWVSVNSSAFNSTLTTEQEEVLSHLSYDAVNEKLIADRAIETTLNSLFLGEQHKMSSGAENIFFTNLGSDTNFYPMWGGLKDQSLTENQGVDGYIPPSGRVYTDMFSTTLGGSPVPASSTGYSGDNYFAVSIAGLGITTVAAEEVNLDNVKLEYRLSVEGRPVYKQILPQTGILSAGSTVEWYFDHPVEIHAGTTIFAEIRKVSRADDSDMGVFQVRVGDTNDPTTGLPRYQAIVHNRLFEDKDLELISPYQKYQAMDFGVDTTGSSVFLRDLSLGSESALVAYGINTIEAVANGDKIKIKLKDGQKILVESLPVTGTTIDGNPVNSVLNQAVTELNNLFANGYSFSSQGNPVTGFALAGNNLTLTLQDSTSYVVDVTSLGVDENKFVQSGSLSGSDLELTMSDASTVTIDATNMVNGSQLLAPNVSNQSFDITEGESLNAQIVSTDYIVNQWGETDAPSWVSLNQSTGVLSGTAPAWTDSAADTILINCKAANALGGVVTFQVTLNVQEVTYTNTKSLLFEDGDSSYLGANAALLDGILGRASNGSGSGDAWSVSLWYKGATSNSGQTIFYFGDNDTVNGGHIELRQTNLNGQKRLRLRYGSNGNHLQITTPSGSIDPTAWQHILVTYDGGTTGASSSSMSNYYSRFTIYIDGVSQTTSNTHSNYGYSSGIDADNYRVGRFASGNYMKDAKINQIAIWGSDQSANISDIYNSGSTQDLSLLTTAPDHYYEIESSVTTIQDLIGNAHFVGYNFSSSDLVTDTP